jgi:hypothetical protein
MQYKPANPAANFISPASIFGLVQRLQDSSRRQALRSGSLGSGKRDVAATGDPQDFQALLNVFSKRADRALAE